MAVVFEDLAVPYQGSKRRYAEFITPYFLPCKNFYDVFCGGGAITFRVLQDGSLTEKLYSPKML